MLPNVENERSTGAITIQLFRGEFVALGETIVFCGGADEGSDLELVLPEGARKAAVALAARLFERVSVSLTITPLLDEQKQREGACQDLPPRA